MASTERGGAGFALAGALVLSSLGAACVTSAGGEVASSADESAPPAVANSCGLEDPPKASSITDELGRLLSSPGLCSIHGEHPWRQQTSPDSNEEWVFGHNVELSLSYDSLGRPASASTDFTRICELDCGYDVCDEWELGGRYEDLQRKCEDSEEQSLTWTWDEQSRLVGVEVAAGAELAKIPPEYECYGGESLETVERASWAYDARGRIKTYDWFERSECQSSDRGAETILYNGETTEVEVEVEVEVEIEDVDGEATTTRSVQRHYSFDACGRVATESHPDRSDLAREYVYDDQGRLVTRRTPKGEVTWSYEAEITATSRKRWRLDIGGDRRTLVLSSDDPEEEGYTILLDEEHRVVGVESEYESWVLKYGDCPNSELATTRWRVGDLLFMWDFPDFPLVGEGYSSLDYWLYEGLPLSPLTFGD